MVILFNIRQHGVCSKSITHLSLVTKHVNVGNEPFTNCSVRSIVYMTQSTAKIKKAYRQCLKENNNNEYIALEKERTHVESLKNNEFNAKQKIECCISGNIDNVKIIRSLRTKTDYKCK